MSQYFDPTQPYPDYFEDEDYYVGIVPDSWKTPDADPAALHWYEYDDGSIGDDAITMPGYVPSADHTPAAGKTYYYLLEEGTDMSETAFAYSTYQTYLMYKSSSTGSYAKVVDIKDYPDMVGSPNMLDATTLSDGQEKKVAGILKLGDGYKFTANYTPTNYSTVKSLEGHQYWYALYLGGTSAGVPDGHNGVFSWIGDMRAGFTGKSVDNVSEMTLTATPSTDVQWAASAS